MKHLLAITALLTILLASGHLYARQSKRLALVIGNASYDHGEALKNPVNDAELMSATLKALDFEVIKLTNASLSDMQNGFKSFAGKINKLSNLLIYK